MRIGGYEASTVVDGGFGLDGGAMYGVVPRPLWAPLHPPDDANRVALVSRSLLLRSADRVVLIDAGIGGRWSERDRDRYAIRRRGGLPAALAALRIGVDEVTDVIQTHLHFDHAGGLTRSAGGSSAGDGGGVEPTFPAATLHVQRRNWDWARRPSPRDRGSYRPLDWAPYADGRARLRLLDGAGAVLPGVEAIPSDGHTVGHQSLRVRGAAGEPDLVYLGDLAPTRHHLRLAWTMAYDLNPLALLEDKQRLLREAAECGHWLVLEHDPDAAAVRVRLDGRDFAIVETAHLDAPRAGGEASR